MKKYCSGFVLFAILLMTSVAFAGDTWVNGYWKDTNHDGIKDTYVEGYHRSSPNNSLNDNYSTKGIYNPYTGEKGTVDPYKYDNKGYDYGDSKHKKNW